MFTACTNEHTSYTDVVENEKAKVMISFAPDDGETMTRAMVPVGDVVNRLDVWLFEGDAMAAVGQTEAVAEPSDKGRRWLRIVVGDTRQGPYIHAVRRWSQGEQCDQHQWWSGVVP